MHVYGVNIVFFTLVLGEIFRFLLQALEPISAAYLGERWGASWTSPQLISGPIDKEQRSRRSI